MNADAIEQIVSSLIYLKDHKSKEDLDLLYLDFRTKNRVLYETILKGEFDPIIFKQMMKMKRCIERGEDQYSVDVKFGTYMAEKYIDPVLKK